MKTLLFSTRIIPVKYIFLSLCISLLTQLPNPSFGQNIIPGMGNEKDWNFVIAPYLWFGGLNGTMGVGNLETNVDAGFSDIFSNLNMGFMLYGQIRYKKVGLAVDWLTLNLGLDGQTPVTGRAVNVDPKITFLETSLLYSIVNNEKWSTDLHVGIRSWWMKNYLEAERIIGEENIVAEGEASWVDPIIGINGVFLPHQKWPLNARFDIGGFGAGSDFSWNLQLGAGYRLGKAWTVLLQYRMLGVDYSEGSSGSSDYFKMDVNLQGPLLGIMATF